MVVLEGYKCEIAWKKTDEFETINLIIRLVARICVFFLELPDGALLTTLLITIYS